jgi:hypothetical protein
MDRMQADWIHYREEAALSARLTDSERWAAMRDLYEMYLAFQRTKSPEQIIREIRADWRLNPIRRNPRYRRLLDEAAAAAGGPDGPADDQ